MKYTKLRNIKKSNVFKIPDGYFDELPFIIQTRIYKEKKYRGVEFSWVDFFYSRTVKYCIAAASFTAIIVLGYYLITLQKTGQNIDYLANITKEEIVDYLIAANVDELKVMDIAYKSEKPLDELIINDFEVTDDIIEEFTLLDIDYLDYLEYN